MEHKRFIRLYASIQKQAAIFFAFSKWRIVLKSDKSKVKAKQHFYHSNLQILCFSSLWEESFI